MRGRLKFIALLILLMSSFNALGAVILFLIPQGSDIRLVADYVIPFAFGFASVFVAYTIADREHWK